MQIYVAYKKRMGQFGQEMIEIKVHKLIFCTFVVIISRDRIENENMAIANRYYLKNGRKC